MDEEKQVPIPGWSTEISDVGFHRITIRGYPLGDIIRNLTFTEVVYLTVRGELPSQNHARVFDAVLCGIVDHGFFAPTGVAARVVASANPASGAAPLTVNLSAAGSSDPNGTIELYEWDFDFDGTFVPDWSSATSGDTPHDYTRGGPNYAALRVTDNDALAAIDVVDIAIDLSVTLTVLDDTLNPYEIETARIQAELILHMKKQMAGLVAEQTGQSLETIETDSDRDRWFTAEEALGYGLVDHVVRNARDVSGGGGTTSA